MGNLIVVHAPPGSQVLEDINAVLHYEGLARNSDRLMEADVSASDSANQTDALLYALHFAATCASALSSVHVKTDMDNFHSDQEY